MRVLIIKTSSMGDVIHTLPALTDAGKKFPTIQFDWVVENTFVDIAMHHPQVRKVIPVSLRTWRKKIFSKETWQAFNYFYQEISKEKYDLIIDAQGLLKSAFLSLLTKGKRVGFNYQSAREPMASFAYHQSYFIDPKQHAISRIRKLFSKTLQYEESDEPPEFNLKIEKEIVNGEQYIVLLHGTTWTSKLWPEEYWITLAKKISAAGFKIKISGGDAEELQRANRIADHCASVQVMGIQNIASMMRLLNQSAGVVSVDTGFGHLAAALTIPTIALYGATNAMLTGTQGSSINLSSTFSCSPCLSRQCHYQNQTKVRPACFEELTPNLVWEKLQLIINR